MISSRTRDWTCFVCACVRVRFVCLILCASCYVLLCVCVYLPGPAVCVLRVLCAFVCVYVVTWSSSSTRMGLP